MKSFLAQTLKKSDNFFHNNSEIRQILSLTTNINYKICQTVSKITNKTSKSSPYKQNKLDISKISQQILVEENKEKKIASEKKAMFDELQSQNIFEKVLTNLEIQNQQQLLKQKLKTELWSEIKQDAFQKSQKEPILDSFFEKSIIQHKNLQSCLVFNLSNKLCNSVIHCDQWRELLNDIFDEKPELIDHMVQDLLLVKDKDAAFISHINTLLYLKGFSGLCMARIGQHLYRQDRKEIAFIMQNRTSELFGMDIHPGSYFEEGIFFDHASGLVIGETSSIGSGTVILHNVTLGATGKEAHGSDRHPKIGNDCYIGSNVTILGNIQIGNNVKIGAGTICLKPVPDNKTAIGVPAKILG